MRHEMGREQRMRELRDSHLPELNVGTTIGNLGMELLHGHREKSYHSL